MKKNKADIKNKGIITLIIILIIISDLILLYIFKYKNQQLPLSNFNLSNQGNLFNIAFTFILIVEILIYTFNKRIAFRPKLLIFFTVLMTLLLILSEVFMLVKISLPYYYILDHPLRDFIRGALFSVYQFSQFLFISVLWYNLFGKEQLILLKSTVNSIVISILLLFYGFINLYNSTGDNLEKIKDSGANYVGVVLGAAVWTKNEPSPSLASRIDKAFELYKSGIIKKIQVTGGNAPGELSESEVSYKYLVDKGIDPADIWIEKKTASTIEQIRFIKNNLVKIKNIRNIIIISDAYHLKRIKEICKFFNIRVKETASDLILGKENKIYHKTRESIALLIFWFFAL